VYSTELADEFDRTLKLAVDSGEAKTWAEADALFKGYRLQVVCGPRLSDSATLQAALLTIVNTAARCFLGGIDVYGCPDGELGVTWESYASLHPAIRALGARISTQFDPSLPSVQLDSDVEVDAGVFSVRLTFEGWCGGIVPSGTNERLAETSEFPLAGVTAAAVAVSEAFQSTRKTNVECGHRPVGVSLWNPGQDFLSPQNGPTLRYLPSRLWLVGLGHIGQAFLWILGLMPYPHDGSLELVLQDYERLTKANLSTGVLTFPDGMGIRKTRALGAWCDRRGFQNLIVERRFAANFQIADDEPSVGICAVDNPLARSVIEKVGFKQIIEGGLGSEGEEYLAFRLHSFPAPKAAAAIWTSETANAGLGGNIDKPAYKALGKDLADECGITMLAGKAVGASFVGVYLATLMLAELLRDLHGGWRHQLVDGSLRTAHVKCFPLERTSDRPIPNLALAALS
jgi:hypothetical protein